MSDDELTRDLNDRNQEVKPTQPTITAVFRLLQDLDTRLNGRLDSVETRLDKLEVRLDALESRVSRGFETIDERFAAMSDEMKAGLLRLSDMVCDRIDRSRLHAESDYEDLLRRLRKLESKAS